MFPPTAIMTRRGQETCVHMSQNKRSDSENSSSNVYLLEDDIRNDPALKLSALQIFSICLLVVMMMASSLIVIWPNAPS